MESTKKILLFGGSYNPIHHGHINAAINASKEINADEVWLMPRKYNYDGSLLTNIKDRLNMINLAIKDLPNFHICKLELLDNSKKLIYTYNTAKKIKKLYPNYDFNFLIGADQLNNFRHWYNVEKLSKLFNFVCYKRPGYVIDETIVKDFNIKVIDGCLIDVSSTIVRSGIYDNIDLDIKEYINSHELYLKERVMPKLPEERFIHVLSTARLAKRIAISNHLSKNNAYVAGILHDIAKGLSKDEIYNIFKKEYPQLEIPNFAKHAYVSEYLAYKDFGITNKSVLKAIRNHCLPTKNMSKLDKIIYLSDKLDESRTFASSLDDIRKIAFYDIDLCFIKVMEDQLDYLKKNNKDIDKTLVKMIKYYKERYGKR